VLHIHFTQANKNQPRVMAA